MNSLKYLFKTMLTTRFVTSFYCCINRRNRTF